MSKPKEKPRLKKKEPERGGYREEGFQLEEERFTRKVEVSSRTSKSSESLDLTEKLKAAFHEKPKEDPELERKKELDHTIRDFRKSFRDDMRDGVKQASEHLADEVKQASEHLADGVKQVSEHLADGVKSTITTIKEAGRTKRKEKDAEQDDI